VELLDFARQGIVETQRHIELSFADRINDSRGKKEKGSNPSSVVQ
jgi:hypothetical protein